MMMNSNDLHEKMKSSIKQERLDAIAYLKHMSYGDRQFIYLPLHDFNQVWEDLHKLTSDQDSDVRNAVAGTINSVFFCIPDKDQALADLIRLISDQDSDVRWTAANTIGHIFSRVSDKNKAWEDIIKLITVKDNDIRRAAASTIVSVFVHIPDKEQAWGELHKLTSDNDEYIKKVAASTIGHSFRDIPNKNQAVEDLNNLASIEDNSVKQAVAIALGSAFPYISDKGKFFKCLFRLMDENDIDVKRKAELSLASTLSYIFDRENINKRMDSINSLIFTLNNVSDKEKAWTDFIKLISDNDYYLRVGVMNTLCIAFSHVPNKDQIWNDLYKLTDKDSDVNWTAARTLYSIFPHVPYKEQALVDLIRLTSDHKFAEIWNDKSYIIANFFDVLNEEQVCKSLHEMTSDKDSYIRWTVVSFIESFFPYISDKEQAWSDLIKLTLDVAKYVRKSAASSLASVFPHVPNKNRAWRVLHELTLNKDRDIRWGVSSSLGSVYSYAPDKKQVWDDLIKLASDEKNYVRMGANYSLGRILILMASESTSEDEYRDNLKEAINFFKKSSEDFMNLNPSKFCLPFYYSFYIAIFNEMSSQKEIDKCLVKARKEIGKSENKKILIEAVENLVNALSEVQNFENMDLETKKVNLKSYRKYCDFAANLLDDTQKSAPVATAVLKKSLLIINDRIKSTLEEIQEKSNTLSKQTIDTPLEKFGKEVNSIGQTFLQIRDYIGLEKSVRNMHIALESICNELHEKEKGKAFKLLKDANEENCIEDKLDLINMVLSIIPSQIGDLSMNIVNQYGSQNRYYNNSEDHSVNIIGDLATDIGSLKDLIERDYNKNDKKELLQTVEKMKLLCNEPSKKSWLREKLGWLLSRTSDFASISSLAITILQNVK